MTSLISFVTMRLMNIETITQLIVISPVIALIKIDILIRLSNYINQELTCNARKGVRH